MREVVLDTETTGIEVREGHRIIEIGCVELLDRRLTGRHFHVYIDPELERLGRHGCVADHCSVVDTLLLARHKYFGQRNTLDALCKRYGVDNSQRELHGALLDAEILADVYLIMTGGQTALVLAGQGSEGSSDQPGEIRRLDPQSRPALPVVRATEEELAAHEQRLAAIEKAAGFALWRQMEAIEA